MSQADYEPDPKRRKCWIQIVASGGIALLAIASAAESLEKYLYLPGTAWIVFGTFVACMWAYEVYCKGGQNDDGAVPALSIFDQSSSYVLALGLVLLAGSAVLNRLKKMDIPRL